MTGLVQQCRYSRTSRSVCILLEKMLMIQTVLQEIIGIDSRRKLDIVAIAKLLEKVVQVTSLFLVISGLADAFAGGMTVEHTEALYIPLSKKLLNTGLMCIEELFHRGPIGLLLSLHFAADRSRAEGKMAGERRGELMIKPPRVQCWRCSLTGAAVQKSSIS